MRELPTLQFVLTGFTQDKGMRVFAFDRISEGRVRTKCTVRADLAMSRTYGIHLQELPLLCRGLLDRGDEQDATPALTFAEPQMMVWADERLAARNLALSRKRPPRRPTNAPSADADGGTPRREQPE